MEDAVPVPSENTDKIEHRGKKPNVVIKTDDPKEKKEQTESESSKDGKQDISEDNKESENDCGIDVSADATETVNVAESFEQVDSNNNDSKEQ